MNDEKQDRYMTLLEVASECRVSKKTIYRALNDGRLKAYKVGRQWRFKRSDVDRFVTAGTEASGC